MKKSVIKYLSKKDFNSGARQCRNINARLLEAVDLADGNAVHALHRKDGRSAVIPHDFRHPQQISPATLSTEVASQLTAIRGLPQEIELVVQVLIELSDHLAGLEASTIRHQALNQPS